MKYLKLILGISGGGIAVIGALWAVFTILDIIRDNQAANVEFQHEVREYMGSETRKTDSLIVIVEAVRSEQWDTQDKVQNLQNSYTRYLKRDESLTRDEFIKYMEGLYTRSYKGQVMFEPID